MVSLPPFALYVLSTAVFTPLRNIYAQCWRNNNFARLSVSMYMSVCLVWPQSPASASRLSREPPTFFSPYSVNIIFFPDSSQLSSDFPHQFLQKYSSPANQTGLNTVTSSEGTLHISVRFHVVNSEEREINLPAWCWSRAQVLTSNSTLEHWTSNKLLPILIISVVVAEP